MAKRTDIEAHLRAHGWEPCGPSGANHTRWCHPKVKRRIAVRNADIIPDATAERLMAEAEVD